MWDWGLGLGSGQHCAARVLLIAMRAVTAAAASKSEWLREEEQHDYNYHAREVYIGMYGIHTQ